MTKTLHFKNKAAYRKWVAYGHIHHVFSKHKKASKYPRISIHGKHHKVHHSISHIMRKF